jgi:hypothetical protein
MIKKQNLLNNNQAVASAIETLASLAIVLVILLFFFASVNGFFIQYTSITNDQLVTGIETAETILKDTGTNADFENDWENDDYPGQSLDVLGLGKDQVFIDYDEENDYKIIYINTPLPERGLQILQRFELQISCFLADTKIIMADGTYKNIEDIQTGDIVKAFDEQTNTETVGKVTTTFHHPPEEMTEYYLIINGFLKVTPNHRVYTKNKWVFADNLKIGDILFTNEQGTCKVQSIEKIFEKVPTFDFEVEKHHNYFVQTSNDPILAHNRASKAQKMQMYWDPETGTWVAAPQPNNYYYIAYLGSDPISEESYTYELFSTMTNATDFISIFDHLQLAHVDHYMYGYLDPDKLEKLDPDILPYEKVKASLGLGPGQNIHISITNSLTGNSIAEYGEKASDEQIKSIYTRNVVVFPNQLAKFTMTVT